VSAPNFGEWLPIETAPKNAVVLVNDTTGNGSEWCAAKHLDGVEWAGWIYDDELLNDHNPTGPEPTHWMPLPPPPTSNNEPKDTP